MDQTERGMSIAKTIPGDRDGDRQFIEEWLSCAVFGI